MEVKRIEQGNHGGFVCLDNMTKAGQILYTWFGPDKFIVERTEIEDGFNRDEVIDIMLMAVVQFARENHLKILPLCPQCKVIFNTNHDISDVLFGVPNN